MNVFPWIWARLQESSTWAGIGLVTAALHIDPSIFTSSETIIMAVGGALAVIIPESKKIIAAVQAKK